MKKKLSIKKIFTTSLLSTLALSNIEFVNASNNPFLYEIKYSNSVIKDDPLPFDQIGFLDVKNITLLGVINVSDPTALGILILNSSPTFENSAVVFDSIVGIMNFNSISTFNHEVIVRGTTDKGINNFNGSSIMFNGPLTVEKNSGFGILNFDKSEMVFNAPVIINYNNVGMQTNNGSNTLFNDLVTVTNNTDSGVQIGGTMTFNKDLYLGNNMVGMYIYNDSIATINGNITATENKDGDIIIYPANLIFNNDIIVDADIKGAFANAGNITFNDGPTIKKIIGNKSFPVANVTFAAKDFKKTAYLNNDIYAGGIELGELIIGVDADTMLTGITEIITNTTVFDLTKDLTLNGPLIDGTSLGINLTGAGRLIITGNNALNTAIKATSNGNGNLVFTGGPTINQPLGASGVNLASVTFSAGAGNTATLHKNINANKVTFGG
ncbi:MAG: hypothetical protein EKK61_06110, partial [Rickettsiales bacterium]